MRPQPCACPNPSPNPNPLASHRSPRLSLTHAPACFRPAATARRSYKCAAGFDGCQSAHFCGGAPPRVPTVLCEHHLDEMVMPDTKVLYSRHPSSFRTTHNARKFGRRFEPGTARARDDEDGGAEGGGEDGGGDWWDAPIDRGPVPNRRVPEYEALPVSHNTATAANEAQRAILSTTAPGRTTLAPPTSPYVAADFTWDEVRRARHGSYDPHSCAHAHPRCVCVQLYNMLTTTWLRGEYDRRMLSRRGGDNRCAARRRQPQPQPLLALAAAP